ncbi:hypothetical protein E2X65_15055 [Salmonella enterica]|nr:hypothetical protein [Salmonella enterica]
MRYLLPIFFSSLFFSTDIFAAHGCGFMIGSASSLNVTPNVIITPATAGTQALLPNQSDLFPTTMSYPVSYWSHDQNPVSKTIIFKPENTEFTPDPNNSKGWLVDSTIPGLYFTLSVNLPNPTSTKWGSFSPAMPIWLSNDASINQSSPQDGWGCANDNRDTHVEDRDMTFSLTFYTTSDFDPANAAGKQLLTTKKRAGTIDNTKDSGGEFPVFLQGPITIASASCAAFEADKKVDLGDLYASDIRANPDGEFNKTPFQITLSNCYAKPDLVMNLSTNQIKNNLLVNTNGKAGGIGVGLGYNTATTSERLDLTKAVTIDSANMNYASSNGNGVLNMYAFLSATDKATISAGSVDISAVIILSHP